MMNFRFISVEKESTDIYVITLQKPPENRLNVAACQELIQAYHSIVIIPIFKLLSAANLWEQQQELGVGAEGAVILRGHNAKFFSTVGTRLYSRNLS
jgi:hypothetical protein